MRVRLIGLLAATVALGTSQSAFAEELLLKAPVRKAPVRKAPIYKAPVYKAPPVTEAPGGFYVGAHIGGGWTHNSFSDPRGLIATSIFRARDSEFLGGAQLGYDWRFRPFVLGIQGDISFTDMNATTPAPLLATTTVGNNTKWISTLTGRVGYAWDKTLWYVKGGGAWVSNHYAAVNHTIPVDFGAHSIRSGYVVGGGLEYALTPNWSGFLEYNYIELSAKSTNLFDPFSGTTVPLSVYQNIQMLKVGINYKLSTPRW